MFAGYRIIFLPCFTIFAISDRVMTSQAKRAKVKRLLKARGWTQSEAAKATGVTFEHLNRVLNGHRQSARLIAQLEALPALEVASAQ